jgi:hypothetical protein
MTGGGFATVVGKSRPSSRTGAVTVVEVVEVVGVVAGRVVVEAVADQC